MADTVRQPNFQLVAFDKKEASYGNGIADGESGSWSMLFDGEPTLPTHAWGRGDNVGRGHEYRAGSRINNRLDWRASRSTDLNSRLAGWLIGLGLGSHSTSSSGTGYKHTFKPLDIDTSTQLPSTALFECQSDEGTKREIHGVCVDSFGISGDANGGWIRANYELIGSGKTDAATAISVPTAVETSPFLFTDISVCTIGASSARNVKERLRAFNFAWANALKADEGYKAGSTLVNGGPYRQRLETGDRKDTGLLTLTLEALRGSKPEVDDYEAGTAQNVVLTLKGQLISDSTYHLVTFKLPSCYIEENGVSYNAQTKLYEVTFKPDYDSGLSAPLSVEVTDAVATRLAAAA